VKATVRVALTGLGLADTPGEFVTRPVESLELTLDGIPGDRHAGRTLRAGARQRGVPRGTVLPNTRQLSVVSVGELRRLAAALGLASVEWTHLGANLCLDLEPLTSLPVGTRLHCPSGAVIVLAGENEPCLKAARAIERLTPGASTRGFVRAAQGLRGVVGWVERAGWLTVSDELEL
jgi:hypothetical protein